MKHLAKVTVALLGFCVAISAGFAQDKNAENANRLCYAIAAMGWCDEFMVPMDLESTLEGTAGHPLRFGDSPYSKECTKGDDRFWTDMDAEGVTDACLKAWDAVGPNGEERAGYLIKSPFAE